MVLTVTAGKNVLDWDETVLRFWEQNLLKIQFKIGPWWLRG